MQLTRKEAKTIKRMRKYGVEEISDRRMAWLKDRPGHHYLEWTEEDVKQLFGLLMKGYSKKTIAEHMKRTEGSIDSSARILIQKMDSYLHKYLHQDFSITYSQFSGIKHIRNIS